MMEELQDGDQLEATAGERVDRLEALYRTEYESLVRFAFTLVSNGAEAEELVQDAFLEVFRRFDDVREPKGYLRSAVVSRCRSLLRRRRLMSLHRPEPPADLSPSAGDLWDVFSRLPDDHRIAVVLRYYGGYRASEIAAITDRPASTVRSHLRRGLAQLRKELNP